MITYKDIKIAVNKKLDVLGVEINSNDVSEGFNRPSFFVQLENNKRSSNESQVHKALTVQIYYFPTDRYEYSIELLEMQESLEELFDLKLRVKDRFFNIDETHALTTDGVLSFSFDIEFYHSRKFTYNVEGVETHSEMMEELDFEKVEE